MNLKKQTTNITRDTTQCKLIKIGNRLFKKLRKKESKIHLLLHEFSLEKPRKMFKSYQDYQISTFSTLISELCNLISNSRKKLSFHVLGFLFEF